jgi:hypothetical protein
MSHIADFVSSLTDEIRFHGGHNENGKRITLKAGKLTLLLENGSLRYITVGKNEIIRMIYFALRDSNWLTIRPVILDLLTEIGETSFKIKYKSLYAAGDISFTAWFIIEGRSDGSIVFTLDGEANSSFKKNRIGFCVLHPAKEYSGRIFKVIHNDNTIEDIPFPEEISPYPIFRDIKALLWESAAGKFRMDFIGDIFETEDQRNWTDSTFKTYSTPLSIPFPVVIKKGTRIYQRIDFRPEKISKGYSKKEELIKISVLNEKPIRIPPIGLSRSSRSIQLTPLEMRILRILHIDHYRVELLLFDTKWRSVADQGIIESSGMNCTIEFALIFDDRYMEQVKDFIEWVNLKRPRIAGLLLFHKSHPSTPATLSKELIPLLREELSDIKIGTGTNANFAELNRKRTDNQAADYVCYSIHPQEHASDNLTLVENLEAQESTIRSANFFSGRKGIWISPVTIQRRFNANNNYYETPSLENQVPSPIDTRLMSIFGACWTAGSLKYLIEGGAAGITYYETAGNRGIIQGEYPSNWPGRFPAERGMIFPSFFVFKFILSNKQMKMVRSTSSNPLAAESIILSSDRELNMIIVNYTGIPQKIKIYGCTGQIRYYLLNSDNYHEVVSNYLWTGNKNVIVESTLKPLMLEPYSIIFAQGRLRKK